jgi:hypothetical protein
MTFDEDKCMNNSYLLVTGKKKLEDFFNTDDDVYFVHNPDEPILNNNHPVYEILIDHFIYTEEYEKCQELVAMQKNTEVLFWN